MGVVVYFSERGAMVEILRCLLIEDRLAEARQTQILLAEAEKAGELPTTQVYVEQVSELSDALARLDCENFDILFLELGLPGADGLEVLVELKQKYPALPVVVLSRDVDQAAAQQALNYGATDCLFLDQADSHRLALAVRRASEHSHLQVKLRAGQERLDWLENSISEVVWQVRSDLHFQDVTQSILQLSGFSVEEVLHMTLLDLLTEPSRQIVRKAIKGKRTGSKTLEVEHFRKDGSLFWAEIVFLARGSQPNRLFYIKGVTRDISEKHSLKERVQNLGMHDEMTGLYNQAYFQEELARLEFSRLYPISILVAELEGAKAVNAESGSQAGDELMKRASAILRQVFRTEDLVARISADEFVILLPRTTVHSAGRAVQRVVDLMDQENLTHGSVPLHMSLRIATVETGQSLVKTFKAARPKKFS